MPLNFLQRIKKTFSTSSNIEKLELELQKDLKKQKFNTIKSLVRALYLNNEILPVEIIKKNPTKIFNALKAIIQEASFDPRIIYHDSYDACFRAKKHANECHCVIFYHPNMDYFIFDLVLYDAYRTKKDKAILFQAEYTCTQEIRVAGAGPLTHEQSAPIIKRLIKKYLTTDSRALYNFALTNKARYDLENQPFNLANEYFRQSQIDQALKIGLYLKSSDNGDDFNTDFKKMIAEAYFAGSETYARSNIETLSEDIFLSLKESHNNPEQRYSLLKIEKQRQDTLELQSLIPKTVSFIPNTIDPFSVPKVELQHIDTNPNKRRKCIYSIWKK